MVERKNVFHFPHVSVRILLGPKICTASDKVFVATVKEAAPIGTGGLWKDGLQQLNMDFIFNSNLLAN